ncbi:MAG: type III-A CRISPR-associated RAMP protein Csm5, partial [Anaerolineae bacterium]
VDRVLDFLWPEDVDAMPAAEREKLLRTPPGELLKPEDLRAHPELVLYTMDGTPQVKGQEAGQIREQIKEAFGRLYIPGSTIKGAIRTALARHLVKQKQLNVAPMPLIQGAKKRERADDRLDAELFRPLTDSANYDLLRALRVADSEPADTAPILANVRVFRGKTGQSPIEVEAVPARAAFHASLIVDEYLLQEQAGVLGWKGEHIQAVRNFWVTCQDMAVCQMQKEREFCAASGLDDLANWYGERLQVLKQMRGTLECFLRIGWAGGWENKTLGSKILAADQEAFTQLRKDFGLGKPPSFRGAWTPSQEFPRSRRLVVDRMGRPAAPMGWVLVRLEKLKKEE